MKIDGSVLTGGIRLSPELQKAHEPKKTETSSFGDLLKVKLNEVNDLQTQADQAAVNLATGKTQSLHEAVLAMEMADTSLRLVVTVRNKVLEAYQEIMRMPV